MAIKTKTILKDASTAKNTESLFDNVVDTMFAHRRKVVEVTEALDMSSVATGITYSSAIFTIDADSGAYAITLPTATTAGEADLLLGWYGMFLLTDVHATQDVTVVRGDTTNDTITAHTIVGVAASGAAGGLTIGSNGNLTIV